MTDDKNKDSFGVHAYRWIMAALTAAVALMATRILDAVDKTSASVFDIRERVSVLSSATENQFKAHGDRINDHGIRLNRIENDFRENRR